MKRGLFSGLGLILAFVLFVAVNVLAGATLRNARLDLTENQLYTLSEGSRNVIASIAEPITLRFFFSEQLANQVPQIKTYGNRVRELLEEYAALSGGAIRLEIIDPEPFSDAEDRAVQAGVQAIPLDRSGGSFYFGLVGTNSVDSQEVIPFFQTEKEQFLEYDLTKLIYALTNPKKPQIAVISSLPLDYGPGGMMAAMRGNAQPYLVMSQLRQFFDVKTLDGEIEKIDDSVDVLLLAHAKDLQPKTQYAVDQFVMRGGRLIVFADPWSETGAYLPGPMGRPQPGGDHSSLLPDLFKSWGVSIEAGKYVADLGLAQRVQTSREGQRPLVDYIPWLAVPAQNLSQQDIVTAELGSINLATVGAIKPAEGATTEFEPLMVSSNQAMLSDVEVIKGDPDPDALLETFQPTGEEYVLAARITGPVKSAFPDGPPKAEAKADDADKAEGDDKAAADEASAEKPAEPPPHLTESAEPVNIVLVADADVLDDRFWARTQDLFGQRITIPIANNADLLVNAVDNLSGSDDLISLRSRGRSQRPFKVVEQLRRDAEQELLSQQRALQQKLENTEKKIAELQSKGAQGASALLSVEQQAAIDTFRQDLVVTRQELRAVQRALNKDIERLEAQVKFVNIGAVPLVVAFGAVGIAVARKQRRRRAVKA